MCLSNEQRGNWARAVISVPMMQTHTHARDHLFNRIHSLRSLAIFDFKPAYTVLGLRGGVGGGLNMK